MYDSTSQWLVNPEYLDTLPNALERVEEQLAAIAQAELDQEAVDGREPKKDFFEYRYGRPYDVTDGVLQIPVKGLLLSDFPYSFSFATGYEYIEQAILRGLNDACVEEIAFMMDSPGGTVKGMMELTDFIAEAAKEKPIKTYVIGGGYSAAYAIACVTDEIVMAIMAGVGSVGVVITHADYSKYFEEKGIKFTHVFAGAHKVDGNPYEPLPKDARARMQKSIDRSYDLFTNLVATHRNMSQEDVKATEALTYQVEEAIDVGFADRLGTLAKDQMSEDDDLDGSKNNDKDEENPNTGEQDMTNLKNEKTGSKETNAVTTAPEESNAVTQADVDAAAQNAATAERKRFSDVLASDEHAGREQLATHLLATTDMSAESIIATLAISPSTPTEPKAETKTDNGTEIMEATPGADFKKAMSENNPEVAAKEVDEAPQSAEEKGFHDLQNASKSLIG